MFLFDYFYFIPSYVFHLSAGILHLFMYIVDFSPRFFNILIIAIFNSLSDAQILGSCLRLVVCIALSLDMMLFFIGLNSLPILYLVNICCKTVGTEVTVLPYTNGIFFFLVRPSLYTFS